MSLQQGDNQEEPIDSVFKVDSVYMAQSNTFFNCVAPRDLSIIDKLRQGDSAVFNKGSITHNQVRAKIRGIVLKGEDKEIAVRVGKSTVNVWRWK